MFFPYILMPLMLWISCNIDAPDIESETEIIIDKPIDYHWSNVRIGGGGYVTGMVVHPVAPDRKYIRTDVGGAYRWEDSSSEWIPMLDDVPGGEKVDGIALDPNDPDRIYVALNDGVYRSNDQGKKWTRTLSAKYSGNGDLRWTGECLAVDPLNSSIVFAGTRTDGLWLSTNGASSWSKIPTIPTSNVRSVVIDPLTSVNGRSVKVYVGIPGQGIFASTDGGYSFSPLAGSPQYPNRMQVQGGSLYVAHSTGVSKFSGGRWVDISPSGTAGKNYCGLAVDLHDTLRIAVAQRYSGFNNAFFRSVDGGSSWEQINTSSTPIVKHVETAWWPQSWFSCATATIVFDPFNPGSTYYTDWFGIWHTPDIWSNPPLNWHTREKGHEEVVVLTLAAPPGASHLYSGVCDVFGFRHDDLKNYPQKRLYNLNECFSIGFCEAMPDHIAILGSRQRNGSGTVVATSSDKGETWTTKAIPSGERLGKIAVSSTDPDKMVYVAGGPDGEVYFTANKGSTWSLAQGAPRGASGIGTNDIWNKDFALAADLVNGNRFYLFKNGWLYASQDAGANWTQMNDIPIPSQKSYLNVTTVPGIEGSVWISLNKNGLYKSDNGGKSFTKLDVFDDATAIAWGAPPSGSKTPTMYCYGTVGGVNGMYRSTTLGNHWSLIKKSSYIPAGVKVLAADRKEFGLVYVGTGGRGIFYGRPEQNWNQ